MTPGALRLLRWGLLTFALVLSLLHASGMIPLRFVQLVDLAIDDARLRASMPNTRDERIVIVDVDDASLARIGRWPWPRERIAALATELFDRQQAAVVGFDMVFAEPAADDAVLAAALRGRSAVLGYILGDAPEAQATGVLPAPLFDAARADGLRAGASPWRGYAANVAPLAEAGPAAGFFNALPDADGVVRSLPLVAWVAGAWRESLALAMLRVHAGSPEAHPVTAGGDALVAIELRQGSQGLRIALDERAAARVPFRGADRSGTCPPPTCSKAGSPPGRWPARSCWWGRVRRACSTCAAHRCRRSIPGWNCTPACSPACSMAAGRSRRTGHAATKSRSCSG